MNKQKSISEYFREYGNKIAFIYNNNEYSYSWLYNIIQFWKENLENKNLKNKTIAFNADYYPENVALFFSLVETKNVAVPLNQNADHDQSLHMDIADIEYSVSISKSGELSIADYHRKPKNEMLMDFIKLGKSGLILFSSGTTGMPKAILHDYEKLIFKYEIKGKGFTTISFLLLDHIGGINTLLYQLANGGTIVLTNDKSTSNICRLVEKHNISLLPVTPTFLNLLLMSEDYKKYDMSSLKVVSYGTEVMPEMTLNKFHSIFPDIVLKQTYGLTEVGILPSKSERSKSRWVKLGGSNYQTKVVDNILWIKTNLSMVGYLNAESPFDSDGWFNTGDIVETNGEYFKVLGRKSDIINIGGLKVFPQEIENVILQMPEIEEVTISKAPHAIMGNVVVATVKPRDKDIDSSNIKYLIQKFCKDKLPSYKIPVKIYLTDKNLYNYRLKKSRIEGS